jgi:hypothetical protein
MCDGLSTSEDWQSTVHPTKSQSDTSQLNEARRSRSGPSNQIADRTW